MLKTAIRFAQTGRSAYRLDPRWHRPCLGHAAAVCELAALPRALHAQCAGHVLMEQSDEGAVQRARCLTLETMAPLSDNPIVMLSAVRARMTGSA
ncbi:hypothetical protein [Sphingomonas pituitosa]|uniref:hypothetical protein n=1 Tax=Sphingomonas pituitosa TaxID=99597 RepID=UPI001470D1F6|nr:hypothetical protein [Sphingomonas pituitosa]